MAAAATAANIDLPEFPITLPPWFDFFQSNHQGNRIVDKAWELSGIFSHYPVCGLQLSIIQYCSARRSVLALPAHEIEIAAFVGLQNRLVEQMRIAAFGPTRRD